MAILTNSEKRSRKKRARRILLLLVLGGGISGFMWQHQRHLASDVGKLKPHRSLPLSAHDAIFGAWDALISKVPLRRVNVLESGSSPLSKFIDPQRIQQHLNLTPETPLLKINPLDIESKVMSYSPLLESVDVKKHLMGGMTVRYTVHQPRALWVDRKAVWLLSSNGKPLVKLVKLNQFPEPHPQVNTDGMISAVQKMTQGEMEEDSLGALVDLPVFSGKGPIVESLDCLDYIENDLSDAIQDIHEISVGSSGFCAALVTMAGSKRQLLIPERTKRDPQLARRIIQVLQYAERQGLGLRRMDARFDEKVVVTLDRQEEKGSKALQEK